MPRFAAIFAFFVALLIGSFSAQAASSVIELNAVKVHVDRENRIHVSYQRECGATFAGFILRTSPSKELFIGIASHRPNARCLELTGLEELVVPRLLASDFAGVTSLNSINEPRYLKLSPIQNFNQVHDTEQFRFEAAYTSQCGTALGMNLFPTAKGYELSILEGRTSKFDGCNRTTKVVKYPHINLSGAPLLALTNFTEDSEPSRYTLHRGRTRIFAEGDHFKAMYLRRCDEAPVGLVRAETPNGLQISILLARYTQMLCPAGAPTRIWTPWPEDLHDRDPIAFEGESQTEQLLIKRPISYDIVRDTLSIVTYGSCQIDVGIVSHTTREGSAVGILQIQTSQPCNLPLKEVTYSYNWSFDGSKKRDIKPLQLVGI
ncbi:MAG: hypothetical protein H7249_02895 [Chitinophagaceae bacterium]|nr:hypothetical protein [Oligoflexus sp.]